MQFDINITGLDPLAASITALADALKAGVTANEVIAKASTRKPKPAAPAAVVEEVATPEVGKSESAGAPNAGVATSSTAPGTGTHAETAAPSSPPSEPLAAHQAEAALFNSAAKTDKPPTIVEVRAAIAALAKTDKVKALGILTKYGAQSVSSLKEEHYAAALAEAQ
jgi:hypothetical protein